jgi:hypothetical protein
MKKKGGPHLSWQLHEDYEKADCHLVWADQGAYYSVQVSDFRTDGDVQGQDCRRHTRYGHLPPGPDVRSAPNDLQHEDDASELACLHASQRLLAALLAGTCVHVCKHMPRQ